MYKDNRYINAGENEINQSRAEQKRRIKNITKALIERVTTL